MSIKRWAKNKGLLMPIINLNRKLEEVFFRNRFETRLNQHTPLLVFQMGKVASSSIYHSLKRSYPGIVLHAHIFNRQHDDWRIRLLYEHTIEQGNPLDVISLTREPIGRNISAFFQNFRRDTGSAYRKSKFSTLEMRDLFLKNYDHDIPLVWFDEQVKTTLGIDVFTTPFPEAGFTAYRENNIRLIVFRSEINDEIIQEEIRRFLHLPQFKIEYRNVSSQKNYAEDYRLFRDTVQLPASYISKMCESKYFNHFYDEEFIETVRQKWDRANITVQE